MHTLLCAMGHCSWDFSLSPTENAEVDSMFTQQIDSMDMSLSKLQEKETLEKEMASEGQGSLACCGPWGHRESDPT